MAFLTESEKRDIAMAIAAAEQHTRGELVTVIARCSDEYRYIPLLWAALLALLLPAILAVCGDPFPANLAYLAQICTFLGAAALFQWLPLKMRLIPRGVKHLRARRLAREQFFLQNLHRTSERTGVLLFVSVAEHHVEILADQGIDGAVTPQAWQSIVSGFIGQVRNRQVAAGFLTAIAACGELLATHFPPTDDNRNELPNRLVEL